MTEHKVSASTLEQTINRKLELFSEMLELLEAERDALRGRSHEQLQQATDAKLEVCKALELQSRELPAPIADLLDALEDEQRAKLEPLHTSMLTLARQAQDFNAVNGKIIYRSQQSVRELIGILSGNEQDPGRTYGAHGNPHPVNQATGPSIAQA